MKRLWKNRPFFHSLFLIAIIAFYAGSRSMTTPASEAIMRSHVQPKLSSSARRPGMFALKPVFIFKLFK